MTEENYRMLSLAVFHGEWDAVGPMADFLEEEGRNEERALLLRLRPLLKVSRPTVSASVSDSSMFSLFENSGDDLPPLTKDDDNDNAFSWLRRLGAVEVRGDQNNALLPWAASVGVRLFSRFQGRALEDVTELYRRSANPRRSYRDAFLAGTFLVPHLDCGPLLRTWRMWGAARLVGGYTRAVMAEESFMRRLFPPVPVSQEPEVGVLTREAVADAMGVVRDNCWQ